VRECVKKEERGVVQPSLLKTTRFLRWLLVGK
jgi:hypothetical protein